MKFHLDRVTLDRELDGFEFPDRFDFGASTAGYQVEGGFNGPDEPKNNWYWAEMSGNKGRTGESSRFIEKYEEDFARAESIGLNAFRMGIEWARLQPTLDPNASAPPPFSVDAARTYARIMATAYDRGMFPAVTLFHWTYPLFAGADIMLDWPRWKESFGAYVDFSVREINRILIEEFKKPPIPYFITMNEPIAVPMTGYFLGVFPTGTKGLAHMMTCYENILMSHVLCYRTIHRIYREKKWAAPTVTINTWAAAAYEMDKIAQDVFLARQNGVDHAGMGGYLTGQRERFRERIRSVPYMQGPQRLKRAVDGFVDWSLWRKMRPDPMPRLADYIFEGDEPRLTDAVGFDLYDPFLANNIDFGFPRLVGVRSKPYEWHFRPETLIPILEGYSWTAKDVPIHMLEHGVCHRAANGRTWPHPDGVTRDVALKIIMLECVRAMKMGLKLRAFYYWSLVDNYEWGSFEPRFGLFGVDYENGARRLPTDIHGTNAAGAFKLFVEAFRARDINLLRDAFIAQEYPVIEV